jgi:hypothetical protein
MQAGEKTSKEKLLVAFKQNLSLIFVGSYSFISLLHHWEISYGWRMNKTTMFTNMGSH